MIGSLRSHSAAAVTRVLIGEQQAIDTSFRVLGQFMTCSLQRVPVVTVSTCSRSHLAGNISGVLHSHFGSHSRLEHLEVGHRLTGLPADIAARAACSSTAQTAKVQTHTHAHMMHRISRKQIGIRQRSSPLSNLSRHAGFMHKGRSCLWYKVISSDVL